MTYGDMRRAITGMPVTVASALLPDGMCGAYDNETRVILIDRRLTYASKRCTLMHEMIHWWHGDSSCNPHSRAKNEYRTRHQTALLLIDPIEYATLERMYEGDAWHMAAELGVTVQVIRDYQDTLSQCA
ncbi:ImmA/IrrE family metallo-endopeptidase [Bifidobacterium panos]|uniref:IrrE N-terminal-like domain-containing protein n=1 Tax=Bifidobacterium panos TaxID=2675321 RepID=A0ABX1T0W6_9BIFI|nr:ImmA/IrrE family metallo-endopeptidase [Bifidobacterium sp. DSM 109963]NMN02818.1 hypothetical protein [Bifidobacterium sp. DSM 109963]